MPGDKILTNDQNATDHEEDRNQDSSQKRHYSGESNVPANVMKSGEREAFVFKEGNMVYRCVAEQEGYQCCMCPNVFGQLGRHISSSKCGETLDVKRFTTELKKYLRSKNKAKCREKKLAENPIEYRQIIAQFKMKSREKKLAQNSEECRRKEAEKINQLRNKKLAQNSEECRQKEAEKMMQLRKKNVLNNPEVYKQKKVRNQQKSVKKHKSDEKRALARFQEATR